MSEVLRIMTCGSVDDGKSTLIGHLLFDAKMLFADQEKALELESRISSGRGAEGEGARSSGRGEEGEGARSSGRGAEGLRDYSLLLDGLSAEREQGITIDVAYRYFATEKRSFIVADTPGHEEYTRNMAVAASASDLAVLLIDACKGVRTQTRRHLMICEMMGIRDYLFAVNKMDAVGYSEEVFRDIEKELRTLIGGSSFRSCEVIPVSALEGDNVTAKSGNMLWYEGMPIIEYLEKADVAGAGEASEAAAGANTDAGEEGFVMPIQRVIRCEGRRGLQGNIAAGKIRSGDEITIYPGGTAAAVDSINVAGREADEAGKGMAVTVELSADIDISRGYVLAKDTELKCTDMFEAKILWMDEEPLTGGRTYLLKLASQNVNVSILKIKYGIDPDTGNHIAINKAKKNTIACVDIACHGNLVFDSFKRHQAMGRFILIDKVTNSTAGCGTIMHSLRRSENLRMQIQDITREARSKLLGQRPVTLWFTGLSGSGKSVVANELEKIFVADGRHTMLLDGDNVRLGINKDLGFNDYDRRENIRRVAEIARLLNEAGIIVITAFISPFEEDREMARRIIGEESFAEIYLSTPVEECERRDVKGLYMKARKGEIPNFTGIGSPYQAPENPDIRIDTTGEKATDIASCIYEELKNRFQLQQ